MKRSDCTLKSLERVGFSPIFEGGYPVMDLEDIAYRIRENGADVRLESTGREFFKGSEYTDSGLWGYGSTYQDVYKTERLMLRMPNDTEWYAVAKRDVFVRTILVSNFCGD